MTDQEKINTWPGRIWLQADGGDEFVDYRQVCKSDVTWCADHIFGADVEYLRADLVVFAPTQPEPERDERGLFEEWFFGEWPEIMFIFKNMPEAPMFEEANNCVNSSWLGWQARAALERR